MITRSCQRAVRNVRGMGNGKRTARKPVLRVTRVARHPLPCTPLAPQVSSEPSVRVAHDSTRASAPHSVRKPPTSTPELNKLQENHHQPAFLQWQLLRERCIQSRAEPWLCL